MIAMKSKDLKFEANPDPRGTNELLELTDSDYVSFNPCPFDGVGCFRSEGGSSETALTVNGQWLVLNGDFRKEVEAAAAESVEAVIAVFKKLAVDHRSGWSDMEDEE